MPTVQESRLSKELIAMNRSHIMKVVIVLIMTALLLTACNPPNTQHIQGNSTSGYEMGVRLPWTFEDVLMYATDVVVAQYVTRRPFGQHSMELEFIVHDRIFGDAADRIFVYLFSGERRSFTTDTQYLLPLVKISDVYSYTHEDGFMFLTDLTLDLNNPQSATLYNEPLNQHSTGMNFNSRNLAKDSIISYATEVTQNNTPARGYIRSDDLTEIITGSPYVVVVDITEIRRLVNMQASRDWIETDIYYVTVTEVLNGNIQVGDVLRVVFFADTVFLGETHIISIEPDCPYDPYLHTFTSRHSLHTEDQLPEILQIIADQQMYPYLIHHTDGFTEIEIRL